MTKRTRYQEVATPELVALFESITTEQCDASWCWQASRYNRLFGQMVAICDELKSRDDDQRLALLPLLQSQNVQVRLMAAIQLLALAPQQARDALESVIVSGYTPQDVQARSMLRALDEGTYVPQ
ncbi:DUF2019 domain-containing protein [Rhodopseudomonas telluris]|uniref:DUF2019 domain-containing protein n=1 Tax=Rhodopseudomonas telluris TaxID=644215 RepID=A0ABV6ET59_9BRAD